MNDTIFFSVDCQKDFINPDGALYIKDAELIKPQLKYLTDYAREHNIKVISTADRHTKNDLEISDKPDFKNTFPEHCIAGTHGLDFIEEADIDLKEDFSFYVTNKLQFFPIDSVLKSRNIILFKNDFDIFKGNKYTEKVLELLKPNAVIIYGVATEFCINAAVLGLIKRGYKVYAVIDAMKALPNTKSEDIFINWLNDDAIYVKNLITLITTKQLEKILCK